MEKTEVIKKEVRVVDYCRRKIKIKNKRIKVSENRKQK